MAAPRFAWGIDIGNRALKAVKLVRDGDASASTTSTSSSTRPSSPTPATIGTI